MENNTKKVHQLIVDTPFYNSIKQARYFSFEKRIATNIRLRTAYLTSPKATLCFSFRNG